MTKGTTKISLTKRNMTIRTIRREKRKKEKKKKLKTTKFQGPLKLTATY